MNVCVFFLNTKCYHTKGLKTSAKLTAQLSLRAASVSAAGLKRRGCILRATVLAMFWPFNCL